MLFEYFTQNCLLMPFTTYVVVTEVDKYSNTLFVSVAKSATIDVLAVDIGGGRQSLYKTIVTSNYQTSKEGDGNYTPFPLRCHKLHVLIE